MNLYSPATLNKVGKRTITSNKLLPWQKLKLSLKILQIKLFSERFTYQVDLLLEQIKKALIKFTKSLCCLCKDILTNGLTGRKFWLSRLSEFSQAGHMLSRTQEILRECNFWSDWNENIIGKKLAALQYSDIPNHILHMLIICIDLLLLHP